MYPEQHFQLQKLVANLSCRLSFRRAAELATLVQLRVPKGELPPTDTKPMYRTVVATMAAIDPAQTLFYEACPANNRKACVHHALGILPWSLADCWRVSVGFAVCLTGCMLHIWTQQALFRGSSCMGCMDAFVMYGYSVQVVQQGEGWYCEFDGRTYPDMVRRYIMQVKCMDGSGEAMLSVFDEQVQLCQHYCLLFVSQSIRFPRFHRHGGTQSW